MRNVTDGELAATQVGPDDEPALGLDALTDALNRLGLPALRLTPPGQLPCADTGHPQGLAPGERIHNQAGLVFWPGAEPIAPSGQPAAITISHALTPARRQP